ncbi:sensor histidine kinase regulating citrate/malate metabolism [Paeniglutamicibacter sulfureus]|uniref:histidine kinase n=1 Tax=Paeniglutamicibacter sulfureus TaxID=43666 RepID=A0ABU2BGF1_9MICC|nr:sensor histidine kinase regulating citrate/malate metabolism [Paeniglutamicibacter sulfureus]
MARKGPPVSGHSPAPRWGRTARLSLAGQFLGLQLLILLAVMAGVLAMSLAQATQTFERVESRRSLAAAENLAATPLVRALLPEARPRFGSALPSITESVRSVSGSSEAVLVNAEGTVVTASNPALLGEKFPLGESEVMEGRAWTGSTQRGGIKMLEAHVPVLDDGGRLVGFAAMGRSYPSLLERLLEATPNLLVYLGVSVALGTLGSLLLSRRVKRQTLGLEPAEITGLVEHREAILHGVKEGVVAIDLRERITLANDAARRLLGWPEDCEGRTLADLAIDAALREVLTMKQAEADRLVLVGERMVVFNRRPMEARGRLVGSVTTLRDRTELTTLEKELGATRMTTETLRAQTHEFANQLHTISGLIQLEEYDEVLSYVDGVSFSRTRLLDDVTHRVADPTVAALLIAKSALASERGVGIDLDPASQLGRVDEALSRDLTTVVGNLVDNAIDAVAGRPDAQVKVRLAEEDGTVVVTVQDSGEGVDESNVAKIFVQGYSTKASASEAGRGFGLALTRLVCLRRGGDVTVANDEGAVFTARLGKRVQP